MRNVSSAPQVTGILIAEYALQLHSIIFAASAEVPTVMKLLRKTFKIFCTAFLRKVFPVSVGASNQN